MNRAISPPFPDKHDEILALIETLHRTSQRLEELTDGEVDTVSDGDGRVFLLRSAQEKLQEIEFSRQAAILNALPAHIALIDAEGCILSVNDAWRRYGSANTLQNAEYGVGLNYLDICDSAPEHDSSEARRAAAGIRAVIAGEAKSFSMEYPCHAPTEQQWFSLRVTPLGEKLPRSVVVMHDDITSRKLADFRLHRLNRLHSVLSKVGDAIIRTHDPQVLYDTVCRIVVEFGLLRMVFIAQVDAGAKMARPVASFGAGLEYLLEPTSVIPTDGGPLSQGTVGTAIRTGSHDFCNDIGGAARMKPWREAALKNGLLANASFPLKLRGVVIGVLVLYAGEVDYFQADEINLMITVANNLSFALDALEIEQERLKAEAQFHRSVGILTVASRVGRLGAWVVELPSRVLIWSKEVFAIYELPLDHVPALDTALSHYPLESRHIINGAIEDCIRDGTPFDVELQTTTAKGRKIWVRAIGEAVQGINGAIEQIRGAIQDITDQKLAEEELRVSEERFRSIFASAATGIAVSTPNGHYLEVNQAYCRMLGYTEDELLGMNFASLTHPEDLSVNLQMRDQLLAGQLENFVMEKRYIRKNGDLVWTRHSVSAQRAKEGGAMTLMVIAEDITERIQAQESMLRQQTELRVLFDLIPAMLCFKDTANHFLRVNQRLAQSTGRPISELEGKSASEIYPLEAAQYYADDLEVIQSGEPKLGIVEELRDKDGNVSWVQTDKVPFRGKGSEVIGLVVMSQDITERKREQDELKQLNDKLEDRVRERTAELELARNEANAANQAKSSFLAAMSHEIRTPMNGVIGMIDVIYQSNLDSSQLEMLDLIRESGFALLRIIDDILDFSKIEAGRLDIEHAPFALADTVEKACGTMTHLVIKKNAELNIFIDPHIPQIVTGDGLRLRQVLINLVNNAIKFSSGREHTARVSVRVVLTKSDANCVHVDIQIIDNGIGMDDQTQARLFTAFTQADASITRRFGGTGLGLVISRHLVELMGGDFSLQSVPGCGTTFNIGISFSVPALELDIFGSGDSEKLPNLSDVSCLLIAEPDEIVENIAAYLSYSGAHIERIADLPQTRALTLGLSHGPWVWVIVTTDVSPELKEWRALAESIPEQKIHFVIIYRELCDEMRVTDTDVVELGGNMLTRRRLLHAVAIAAGRETGKIDVRPEQIRLASEFKMPSRDDALRNGRLILVAEDNETNQLVILRQLARLGYAADVANNGLQALEQWRRGDYAMLLSDLHMPDMDGYELASRIRREERGTQHIPIVALSANALKGEDDRCRAAGMDGYLSKPMQLTILETVLNKWLPKIPANLTALDEDIRENKATSAVDLNILKNYVGDDSYAVFEFLKSFRVNATRLAKALRIACTEGQMAQAGKLAHTLKSSSNYVGALALSKLCEEMEDAGDKADAEALSELLPKFEQEWETVNIFLNSALTATSDANSGNTTERPLR